MSKPINIAIIGFTKCGTNSLERYLRKKYRRSIVMRTDSVYVSTIKWKALKNQYHNWRLIAITRNPIDRIHSMAQYYPELRDMTLKEIIDSKEILPEVNNVIEQCNYEKHIKIFEEKYDVKVEVVKLEDMIKLSDFPRLQVTEDTIKWSEEDYEYIKNRLQGACYNCGSNSWRTAQQCITCGSCKH